MKTNSSELLLNATGQLMQQHIFDHLSDEKLAKMNSCLQKLGNQNSSFVSDVLEQELVDLFGEADLYAETTTPQSLHQWQTVMSCYGK
jgi:hypothetical protein